MGRARRELLEQKFINVVDLNLLKQLFGRYSELPGCPFIDDLDGDEEALRQQLDEDALNAVETWPNDLVEVLFEIIALAANEGLEIIKVQARRQRLPLLANAQDVIATKQDPTNVALFVFLNYRELFQAAYDYRALRTPQSPTGYKGRSQNVGAVLTQANIEKFRTKIAEIFKADLLTGYCKLKVYEDGDNIDLVVRHGANEVLDVIIENEKTPREKVVPRRPRQITTLRYLGSTGELRIGGVVKALRRQVADIFASSILEQPGFFSNTDATDLYTLAPIDEAGPDFKFDHEYDPEISSVRIVEVKVDLIETKENGQTRVLRSWWSRDNSGAALQHLKELNLPLGRQWKLDEMIFRVIFKAPGRRPPQVTARIGNGNTLDFRRNRYEHHIHTLLERNKLVRFRKSG